MPSTHGDNAAAAVYAHNDPVMAACNAARYTDIEIRGILEQQFEEVVDEIVAIVDAGNGLGGFFGQAAAIDPLIKGNLEPALADLANAIAPGRLPKKVIVEQ